MSTETPGKRHFHDELDALQDLLLAMAGRAEQSVARAIHAIRTGDIAVAPELRQADLTIDEMETEVDERVAELLALHQPMATDLRFVLTSFKVSNDVERVGDHAVNIARAVRRMRKSSPPPEIRELEEMALIAQEMLGDALAAFVARDASSAQRVRATDDRVDNLRKSLFRIMVSYMLEDPRNIGGGLEILLISQNLERIADLATNIAEDVIYLVEGRQTGAGARSRADHDASPAGEDEEGEAGP
ncbi:MAG: phosphate signaling complex protein PhoU [Gemmatimonadota bacterium]